MIVRDSTFIGGAWAAPLGTAHVDVVNPATEQPVGRVPLADAADVDAAIVAARTAFDHTDWSRRDVAERAAMVEQIAAGLEARADELTATIVAELGVPISQARATHVDQPVNTLRYYASLGREFAFEFERGGKRSSTVCYEPVGVVAAIVPWNAPVRSIVNKLAPALIAGCTVVVKTAPETPLSAYLLCEAILDAGLPPGVVSVLCGDAVTGDLLVRHRGVDKVGFTGSTRAGRQIMAACAERLTNVALELGGKSAGILLDDVDLATVFRRLGPMVFGNNGEACTAQTRLLVSEHRHDDVVAALADYGRTLQVGDPTDPATFIGPLVSRRQRDRVEGYVESALMQGAKAVLGGARPADLPTGWFVDTTVLAGVDNTMKVAREEVFGPVVCLIPYTDLDDAVAIANDSDYGLAGSVWSADMDQATRIARRMRTGTVSINGAMQPVAAPFGGYKQSGIGREYGPEGLHEYLETKSVAARPS